MSVLDIEGRFQKRAKKIGKRGNVGLVLTSGGPRVVEVEGGKCKHAPLFIKVSSYPSCLYKPFTVRLRPFLVPLFCKMIFQINHHN